MNHTRIVLILLAVSLGFGCLGNSGPRPYDFSPGDPDTYEIDAPVDNVSNMTTFFLFSNETVKAVTTFINVSDLEIIVPKDASAEFGGEKGPVIKDLVVIGTIRNNDTADNITEIPYSSSLSRSGNRRIIMLEFEEPASGFAAYSFTWEYGQFYHILSRNETTTIVLPDGHDTGNIILGSPKPTDPDETFRDSEDRVRLVWFEVYPDQNIISVKYYREYLPRVLSIVGIVILLAFLVSSFYFNTKIRTLQHDRETMERDVRKKE